MEFFYPIGENVDNQPVLELLPEGYTFAANIFYPFVKMPKRLEPENNEILHQQYSNEDIFRNGEAVSWENIRKLSGLADISEVSLALSSYITGGISDHGKRINQIPDLIKRWNEDLEINILPPDEDQFSVLLIKDILSVLSSNGAKSIEYTTLYGEHGTHVLKDITLDTMLALCKAPITITDDKEEFVFTCFLDEVTAIFFAKEDFRKRLIKSGFEGVIFGERTSLVWENEDYVLMSR